MKTFLQHPRTAWWLACLFSTLPFLILMTALQFASISKFDNQEILIKTNGATSDILAAVANLKRTDLKIITKPTPFFKDPFLSFLLLVVYLTLWFALSSALVASAEIKTRKFLHTKTGLNFQND